MLNANQPRQVNKRQADERQADQGQNRASPAGTPRRTPFSSFWLILAGLFILNYLIVTFLFPASTAPTEIPYTTFLQQIEAGNVAQVATEADMIQGILKEPITLTPFEETTTAAETEPVTLTQFTTVTPAFANTVLEQLLVEQGVEIDATSIVVPRNAFLTFLLSFGPAVLLIGMFVWLSRRMQAGGPGGAFSFGKSGAKRYDVTGERVTFNDVAGIDEARNELVEIVDFLRNPSKYTRLGGTAPKGVLLVGAPGTGKTLLARAVAGEAGVPFFSMNASEFVEMIVGVGASRVRDLFKQAREAAPAIIFIDELDAIGRARGRQSFGGSSEQEQTLNQILTEMDGFSSREGVIVLAATNRPDVLDPALLRAGRFDRRVMILPPDKLGREKILEVHTRTVPLAPDVNLGFIASITPGLVGADLRNLVNEAALLAARREQDHVTERDFSDALEKLMLGPARILLMSDQDRKRVAYHEGGHAILGLVVPGADPVTRVTITPRGMSLGVTYQRPEDDRYNYPEEYLRARIIGALGGRAAEMLVFGDRTTGAENDLEQVTSLAQRMVTRWGMSEKVGLLSLGPKEDKFLNVEAQYGPEGKPYSEATAELIDSEVRRIVDESYQQALSLLQKHRAALDRLAQALLQHDTLDEAAVIAATDLQPAPTAG